MKTMLSGNSNRVFSALEGRVEFGPFALGDTPEQAEANLRKILQDRTGNGSQPVRTKKRGKTKKQRKSNAN